MGFNIWKDCPMLPLPDVLSFIVDNRGKTVPTIEMGYKLIATNCIRNENLYPVYEKIRYLSEETYQTWFRAHPQEGDIIFVNKGTPGRVCLVPKLVDFCIAQDMMAFRVKENLIYNKYLLATLRSWRLQEQIRKTSVGDVIPHFKKSHLKEILIPIPDMNIQKEIGDMYFILSEKIVLNNKMNKNLEEQAQAIFKSWFVDFEPFQDGEFIESELGLIPKGFEVKSLTDIAEYLNGLAMQKYRPEENEKSYPVLKIKELRQGFCDNTSDRCATTIKQNYIIEDGDVIFSWSGSLLVDLWCGGVSGLNQHLFKVTSKVYEKWFYYMWTNYHLREFQAVAADKATTMGHIKRENLEKSLVLVPSNYDTISKLMIPIMDKIIENKKENKTLTNLRNTLLPKLMSGEVRVKGVE